MSQVQTHFRLLGTRLLLATVFLGSWLVVGLAPAFAAPSLTVNGSSAPLTVTTGTAVTFGIQNAATGDCITVDKTDWSNGGNHAYFSYVTGSTMTASVTMAPGVWAANYWTNCGGPGWTLISSPTVTVKSGPTLTVNGSSAPITVA